MEDKLITIRSINTNQADSKLEHSTSLIKSNKRNCNKFFPYSEDEKNTQNLNESKLRNQYYDNNIIPINFESEIKIDTLNSPTKERLKNMDIPNFTNFFFFQIFHF